MNIFAQDVKKILVGTKIDLKKTGGGTSSVGEMVREVRREEGEELVKLLKGGFRDYMECSALTGEGVRKVFEGAMKMGLEKNYLSAIRRSLCVLF